MRRFLVSPSWRRPAAALALGVASATMSCDPPAPSGACLATEMVSGADFACLRTSPTIVCNDRGDAAGAGLAGCYSASAVVRCWGQSGSNSWANPAALDPTAFDAGAATPGIYLTLGSGPTMESPRRIDRAGRVVPSETDWLQGVRQLAAGGGSGEPFACAVVNEGRVRCEGFGRLGQLGNGPQSGMSRSELSFGGVRARLVTAGLSHACALLEDGSVRCWGDGTYGQLGPAATSPASLPVQVTGLPKVLSFAAGSRHTCAVVEAPGASAPDGAAQTRGEVRCWGQGESGQLGGGAFLLSATPVAVLAPSGSGNLTDVRAIAAGADHTCALVNSGAVQCWGVNGAGQLGVGSSQVRSNRPVAASLPTGVGAVYLSAGREHTCAAMGPLSLAGGFPVRCWGRMGTAFTSPPGVITDELPCCAPTPTNPTGVCPNLRSDPANCGRAGNVCTAGQACVNGVCTCAPRTLCGAACVDLQNDMAHCGRCGNACPSASPGNGAVTCQSGRCALTCPNGRGDCDGDLTNGCETDLTTSTIHCGACGRAVTVANGMPACRMGVAAVMGCNMGFADCDANPTNGCEATLATDSNNCGRCGNRCAGSSANTMSTCAMGSCSGQVCAAGFRDCNNSPSDGCETAMGATCASPATALPMGSRIHRGGHVVNIVTGADGPDFSDEVASFLNGDTLLAGATGEFYKYFRDEYDFLTIVTDRAYGGQTCTVNADCTVGMSCECAQRVCARPSSCVLGTGCRCEEVMCVRRACSMTAAAAHEAVNRPEIPGTGLGRRYRSSYLQGAPTRLRGVTGVYQSRTGSSPPMLHEMLHYWGVDLPTTTERPLFRARLFGSHWGVSSVRGVLGGFDPGTARCASGGALSTCVGNAQTTLELPEGPISDACRRSSNLQGLPWFSAQVPGDTVPFAPLELYIMGLLPRAEVGGPWYVLDNSDNEGPGVATGTALRVVTINDIVAAVGERTPVPMSERAFRAATVVFSRTPIADAWFDNIERWSAILGNEGTDACLLSFQTATGGRATMSTRIGATRVP